MPEDGAAAAAPAAAGAAAAEENGTTGTRRSLRARAAQVSYRDDELAWEALFNQVSDDSDDDDDRGIGGAGGGDGSGGRVKGKRGRPPKNQPDDARAVETILGPNGRPVRASFIRRFF